MAFNRRIPDSRMLVIALCVAFALVFQVVPLSGSQALARHKKEIFKRARSSATAGVPAPRDVIGFMPGDDRKLASWSQIVDYFKRLDRASDRVLVEELGRTTLDRPFLLATISSPANLARLDRFREIQRRLADPRIINSDDREAEKLIAEGRTIVLITFGIHSTEVGSNLVSMNIAHRLAADDSEETREILDNCIVLLVPSLNPDGVDIVKNWYDRTLGTSAEGTGPPELYHHYVGHDNNRDWYAFTQVETQLTIDKVHNRWHPQIVHDIHQQGASGTRFFIPPYVEPWEPNVPPVIQAGVNFMGSSMAKELISQGKSGVVINGVYDAWTPARAYQHYHAGIRILSETASARLASPINIAFDDLRPQVNVDPKIRSWNFPLVWPGGEWRLANIVDYMQSGAFALMRNAARYRRGWVSDFYKVGRDAVRELRPGELFAYLLPLEESGNGNNSAGFWHRYGMARLEAILTRGGVEISRARAAFEVGGARYPAGTRIVLIGQPYGAFAKTLLERQHYPDLREYPGGPPRRPYDVTAHTLSLMMGIKAVEVNEPFALPSVERVTTGDADVAKIASGSESITARLALYKSYSASMDEGWTRWVLDRFKTSIKQSSLMDKEVRAGDLRAKYDCIIIPSQGSGQILSGLPAGRYPEEVAGGIGREGVQSLKRFVEEGGTIITLNDASEFAIEQLRVPVKNVLAGVSSREFYCPGSILKIEFDANDPLARGAPTLDRAAGRSVAWFERGPAFEPTGSDARVVARFADAKEVLLSGWLLGSEKIARRGAIVEVKMGKGRVIMFAFRPQYRGQPAATFPFLFNAIGTSAAR
ncbi:MAG: M14 family metallopeptidase [Blastocatellia bacterium]|nr:M14 family metallopeptidase [Blastocatellia bacterium]